MKIDANDVHLVHTGLPALKLLAIFLLKLFFRISGASGSLDDWEGRYMERAGSTMMLLCKILKIERHRLRSDSQHLQRHCAIHSRDIRQLMPKFQTSIKRLQRHHHLTSRGRGGRRAGVAHWPQCDNRSFDTPIRPHKTTYNRSSGIRQQHGTSGHVA